MPFRRSVGPLALGLLALTAFFAGFRWNVWHAAERTFYLTAQKDTEALVLGRLSAARELGFWAKGGLLGFVGDRPELLTFDTDVLWRSYNPAAQRQIYLAQGPFHSFGPYFTHSGLQGSAFVLLDRALGFLAPATRLELFISLTSALVAAAYAVLVVWLGHELGLGAALGALVAVLLSPWLAVFGHNLYFSLWLFWLPPLALGATLALPRGKGEGRWLALASFLGFLPRFLAGYEYITETVALAALPLVWFSLRDALGVRAFVRRCSIAAAGCTLALILSLGLLTLQIGQATGSSGDVLEHLRFAVARRTHGDPSQLPPIYASSLQADTGEVVGFYLQDPYDRAAAEKPRALRWWSALRPRDWLLGASAAAAWLALRYRALERARRARALALLASVALTFAGVLAWLTVFKAHSFIHTHVNPVLWHLGFFLLAAALVGWALEDAARLVWRRFTQRGSS